MAFPQHNSLKRKTMLSKQQHGILIHKGPQVPTKFCSIAIFTKLQSTQTGSGKLLGEGKREGGTANAAAPSRFTKIPLNWKAYKYWSEAEVKSTSNDCCTFAYYSHNFEISQLDQSLEPGDKAG